MTTPGFSVHVDRLVDVLATELDEIISRLTREDSRLVIIREPNYWVCEDVANEQVMFRNTDPLTLVKWARAFTMMTAGATLDERSVSAALGSGEAVETTNGTSPEQDAQAAADAPAPAPERHLKVVL